MTRGSWLGVGGRSWHVAPRARAEGERPLAGAVLFVSARADHNQRGTARARSKLECCASSQETASAGACAARGTRRWLGVGGRSWHVAPRRKVGRGLAKYRRGVAEAVLCKYRGLLFAKSPDKITPEAQVALATTKTSQLRSSRTSHRSTRPGNEVAGRLRIQFVITSYSGTRGILNSSSLCAHPPSHTQSHLPARCALAAPSSRPATTPSPRSSGKRASGCRHPARTRSTTSDTHSPFNYIRLDQRRSTTSDTHSLVRARSTRSSWTELDGAMLLIVPRLRLS